MACAGEELVNPATGERIVFLRTSAQTAGELLEMDDYWMRSGQRAPAHVHPAIQERWQVIAGTAAFWIAGRERTARSGETVTAPAGVPHQAWNPTDQPVHVRIQMRPALGWEQFVRRLFALAAEAHASGHDAPDPRSLLELLREFPREIAPAVEQRRPS
jgi:mannose-6-phosphate isomerase-like protein (cupin superfamily)